MERVNIVIGRFQPFTAGHYSCVKAAMREKGLPTVICMINVPESKVDKRHPFTTSMLVNAYSDLFKNDDNIASVVPVINADIVRIAQTLRELGFEIASWTCGTDRYNDYVKMSSRYHEKAGLTDDFEVIEVKRGDEDISATKVRNCLLNDDRAGFFSMVPSGSDKEDLYDMLKTRIDNVYGTSECLNRDLNDRVKRLEDLLSSRRYKKCESYKDDLVDRLIELVRRGIDDDDGFEVYSGAGFDDDVAEIVIEDAHYADEYESDECTYKVKETDRGYRLTVDDVDNYGDGDENRYIGTFRSVTDVADAIINDKFGE